uniref:Putative secreted protein n=1 Tax=Ixodes ricinus TaxID=34613 RepID=A0A6B0TSL9_IXORI
MRKTGRSLSCPASGATFLPSIILSCLILLERARGAKARWKVMSACWMPGVGMRRPAVLILSVTVVDM